MESNYEKQVEALRYCMAKEDGITICELCSYYGKGIECENVLHTDAADAIEELQKTLKAVQKNSEINFKMWKEAQAEVERLQVDLDAAYALMEVQHE